MALKFSQQLEAFAQAMKRSVDARHIAEVRRTLAREVHSIILRRTREGKGVAREDGRIQRLKPLSRSYIDFRRRHANRLSAFTSVRKSNLTFTNQMLGSMTVVERQGKSIITFLGTRDDGKKNSEVAKHVQKARPFLFLAREERELAQRRAIKTWDDLVKRNEVTLR